MLETAQINTLRLLGHTFWRMGYPEKAERLLKALLSLMPGDSLCLRQLAAIALETGRADEALACLDSLGQNPENPESPETAREPSVLLMRAQALWRLERPAEARAVFGDYLVARPAGVGKGNKGNN
ncbi:MAG: tetratricopeptide repeat protein [Deltaproteobacteria bacterium]|jgi:predicted Zn-dependent protease|nr:tetratricopeptide repeat protein [Deltaproteobacteria bacterium]